MFLEEQTEMRQRPSLARLAAWVFSLACVTAMLLLIGTHPAAADDPKPDPAGTANGNKDNAVDAGGTAFSVAAPSATETDPAKKKAYDEYQAQLKTEPLAAKVADEVGH